MLQLATMDIQPPAATTTPKPLTPVATTPAAPTAPEHGSAGAVAVAPKEAAAEHGSKIDPKIIAAVASKPPKATKPAKQPASSPAGVIVVALIVFIVLSAIAYYAYTKKA